MYHRCMWATVFQWAGYARTLRREHRDWLRQLPPAYRDRVSRSAVRTPTFIHILSIVLGRPFNQSNAVLTGILAALFDDLFDERFETPEAILGMIGDPDAALARGERGRDFLLQYRRLRSQLEEWQRGQLRDILLALARCETRLLAGQHWDGHWEERGTAALSVYLTIAGARAGEWDPACAACFGEYLQMMDDYEDHGQDAPEVNYFRIHPEIDLDGHFLDVVVPALKRLFPAGAYDGELMVEFMESFHLFMIDHHRERVQGWRPMPRVVYPWVPAHGPLTPPGLLRLPVWWGMVLFTTVWHRFLPRPVRLPFTRAMLRLFGFR